jgi:hypothetical protein
MASSSSSSFDSTSRERGVGIDGVTTTRGEATLLFLFFFFYSAAFTAEIAAVTAEAEFFPTVDLILRRDFTAPPASGSVQPLHQYLRRPPPTSQTSKSPADNLLEACTCPT